jgi:AcrR family transcriptional regulator
MAPATRQRVLDSAARLITTRGYDEVSIADLVAASGVSSGSIYHHFGAKDGVLGDLLLAAVSDYQRSVLEVLERYGGDPRAGVRAVVAEHLRWMEEHRREARLLLDYRQLVAKGPRRDDLRTLNREFLHRNADWLDGHARAGRMPAVEIEVAHAVVFAPAQELCRRWLTDRTRVRPSVHAEALGAAAWAALTAGGVA